MKNMVALAAGAGVVLASVAVPAGTAEAAQGRMPGKVQAHAKPNVAKGYAGTGANRPGGHGGGQLAHPGGKHSAGGAHRPNRPAAGGRNGNVVAGNTVVVNRPSHGGGYYSGGRYYGPGDWDDDDNDFLEFVGKTAAVTAGVAVVSAVIGSTVNGKPDDPGCRETISNGVRYVNCNGTWYQAVGGGSSQYQVVAPPGP